ncbi:MAG: molybdopterin-dependent oxidoreductase [Haloferacaceae archaeon]
MTAARPSPAGRSVDRSDDATVPRPRVRVVGRVASRYELDDVALVGLADDRRECRYLCASGRRWGGRWRGVPLSSVVERARVAADATHVVARGRGGHAACLPLVDALDGLLAVARDGAPLAPTRCPRLVVPGVDAARTVKGVRELDVRRLAPGDDPTDYERLGYGETDEQSRRVDADEERFPDAENGRARSSRRPSNGETR